MQRLASIAFIFDATSGLGIFFIGILYNFKGQFIWTARLRRLCSHHPHRLKHNVVVD